MYKTTVVSEKLKLFPLIHSPNKKKSTTSSWSFYLTGGGGGNDTAAPVFALAGVLTKDLPVAGGGGGRTTAEAEDDLLTSAAGGLANEVSLGAPAAGTLLALVGGVGEAAGTLADGAAAADATGLLAAAPGRTAELSAFTGGGTDTNAGEEVVRWRIWLSGVAEGGGGGGSTTALGEAAAIVDAGGWWGPAAFSPLSTLPAARTSAGSFFLPAATSCFSLRMITSFWKLGMSPSSSKRRFQYASTASCSLAGAASYK